MLARFNNNVLENAFFWRDLGLKNVFISKFSEPALINFERLVFIETTIISKSLFGILLYIDRKLTTYFNG